MRSDDALAEPHVIRDGEKITADGYGRRKDRRRAESRQLKRGVASAERAMLFPALGGLRVGATLVVASGHGGVAKAVFGKVGNKLGNNMSREEARIDEHAAQRQGCGRSPPRS